MPVGHTVLPEIQTAITTLLNATPAFTSICNGVYDPAPQSQVYPYVTFGNHIESPFLAFGNLGRGTVILMHIWSQAFGFAEAYSILDVMNQTFDATKLSLSNYDNIIILFMGTNKFSDPDGITRHLVARYRTWNTAK